MASETKECAPGGSGRATTTWTKRATTRTTTKTKECDSRDWPCGGDCTGSPTSRTETRRRASYAIFPDARACCCPSLGCSTRTTRTSTTWTTTTGSSIGSADAASPRDSCASPRTSRKSSYSTPGCCRCTN